MGELPIPNHLAEILIPVGDTNNEFEVLGNIQCSCGSKEFKVDYVGDSSSFEKQKVIKVIEIEGNYFLVVKAECLKCGDKHLIFDDDYHGWNGFVCHDHQKDQLPRPVGELWRCPECDDVNYSIILRISSQGKNDFLEEAGNDFNENNWVDAFDWITISLKCNKCVHEDIDWISYETM